MFEILSFLCFLSFYGCLGCLLERAALQLKEGYSSLSPEDQFQAAKQLVLTLSATLASPTSGYRKYNMSHGNIKA